MAQSLLCVVSTHRRTEWQQALSPETQVRYVADLDQALQALVEDSFDAAVIEVDLVRLPSMQSLRDQQPLLPILAVMGEPQPDLINGLHALRCEQLCGALRAGHLHDFLERACSSGRLSAREVEDYIRTLAERRTLRPSDLQLMPVILGEETRESAMKRLGLTPDRLTRRLRQVCRRCDARTPTGAHRNLMREALLRGKSHRRGDRVCQSLLRAAAVA